MKMTTMDLPSVLYPPNRPMERILMPSKTPVRYDHLFFIDVNENGEAIVGSSNVSGSYWEGILFHYKNGAAAVSDHYSGYYISTSSLADAKFLKNNIVVLAEDNGCLSLLTVGDTGDPDIKHEIVFNTSARVEQLATWNKSHRVLACADTTLMIWDMQSSNITAIQELTDYHTELITSVDVNKNLSNIFASASIDRRACIWDDRMDVPATVLYQNEFSGLTSVSWNPAQSEYFAVGTEGGDVYYLDSRQAKDYVSYHNCFNARVHRTVFNGSGFLAVCGETSEMIVLNSNDNFKVAYKNNDHSAYVRGLAWFKETLLSCGFDRKIIKHVY